MRLVKPCELRVQNMVGCGALRFQMEVPQSREGGAINAHTLMDPGQNIRQAYIFVLRESGPLMGVHLSRHKCPWGLVN